MLLESISYYKNCSKKQIVLLLNSLIFLDEMMPIYNLTSGPIRSVNVCEVNADIPGDKNAKKKQ